MLLTLPATPPSVYAPAPWYLRWLETMPVGVVILLGILAAFLWLLKKPIEDFAAKLFDQLTERLKRSSKEPASAADLARKARKAVLLEQSAERLRVEVGCDHVSVYGCQNGEYLRSGEGIDKFVMQAEASRPGDPRYIDVERIVYANDLPRLVLALESQAYLLLWAGQCDDWKVNKMMSERDYASALVVFVRRPVKQNAAELGVIGMFVVSWRECLVYRPDQATKAGSLPHEHEGPTRLLDERLASQLQAYASEFSYTM